MPFGWIKARHGYWHAFWTHPNGRIEAMSECGSYRREREAVPHPARMAGQGSRRACKYCSKAVDRRG